MTDEARPPSDETPERPPWPPRPAGAPPWNAPDSARSIPPPRPYDTGERADWEDTQVYSPVPEPRSDWSRRTWAPPAASPQPTWQPPHPRFEPVVVERRPRRGSVAGPVLLAAILSA